jgi:hypothetical protein
MHLLEKIERNIMLPLQPKPLVTNCLEKRLNATSEQALLFLVPVPTHMRICTVYSGRKITPSLGYVTLRGEGKMKKARGSKSEKSLSEHVFN